MEQDHIPAVVRIGRFLGATRWKDQARAADGWSRYVMQYRAEGTAAIEAYQRSAETAGLRDDFLARFGKVTRLERTVLSEPIFVGPQG